MKPLTLTAKSNVTKYIHYWDRPKWISPKPFSGCPDKCILSNGHGARMSEDSDAVLFHAADVWLTKPPYKRPGQIWIFQTQEPPRNFRMSFRQWNKLFNWTMTYRRDADIPHLYGMFRSLGRNAVSRKSNITEKWVTKNVTIAWFVGRCKSQGNRETYVKLLKKIRSVDIFGICGTKKCERFSFNCEQLIRNVYKFYLSFESNLCRDYITEKLYQVFEMKDVIPIVRGNVYYDQYVPPGLYINTRNFSTIKDLSNYLNLVVTDMDIAHSYLTPRSRFQYYNKNYFCELCQRVHHADKYKRLYDSISAWEFGSSNFPICLKATDIA